jgi:hypothetical protein
LCILVNMGKIIDENIQGGLNDECKDY